MIELQVKHAPEQLDPSDAEFRALLSEPDAPQEVVFQGAQSWMVKRPRTLVVACSDGRLQKSVDEFLEERLGVVDYDRLYSPGGPGGLLVGTGEVRTDQIWRELKFLMDAHRIEEIVLLFHGADRSGPDDAVCAHYKRILTGASRRQIAHRQHADAAAAIKLIASIAPKVRVHVFRAEVRGDASIHFVDLRRR